EAQRERLRQRFGVATPAGIDEALPAGAGGDAPEAVVLAVKPQQMREAVAELAGRGDGRLVVSIAAGVRASDLSRWLGGHRRIVRTMPNTPALIGRGTTGLAALPGIDEAARRDAETILAAVGRTVWV